MELPPPDLTTYTIDGTMRRLELQSYTAGAVREIVAAAIAEERDACWKLCAKEAWQSVVEHSMAAELCADAIRARSAPRTQEG